MRKPTLKEVASAAGVSPSSVSRFVNNPTSIRPLPAMKIEKAIKDLGYIPNILAQGLRGGHRNTIGVVVPGLGPYFSGVCSALSDFFYRHQYLLFICETHAEVERERFYINALISQQVAGILVAPSGKNEDFFLDVHKNFPYILTLDQSPSALPFDCVYEDSVESSYQLAKYLVNKGHKQLVLLFQSEFSYNTTYRVQGTKKAFSEGGLKFEDMYTRFNVEPSQLPDILSDFVQSTPTPTAVIVYSPQYLESTLSILHQLGKQIPSDIEVVGYSVSEGTLKQDAGIPTVIHDPYEVGIIAGDLILRRLRKGNVSTPCKEHLIKPKMNFPTVDHDTKRSLS